MKLDTQEQLTERQRTILRMIVGEYVAQAAPVGSKTLAQKYGLDFSAATVRNDMMVLEQAGYVYHPHPSAGRIPSDKGYRYYIESLMEDTDLPDEAKRHISDQFQQAGLDMALWVQLAAAMAARVARYVAMVTMPAAPKSKLKHIELVPVQDKMFMLIVLLHEGILKQQIVNLADAVPEEDLRTMAHRLTDIFRGLSAEDITGTKAALTAVEAQVTQNVVKIMRQVDVGGYLDLHMEGIAHILRQPEFARGDKVGVVLEAIQDNDVIGSLMPVALATKDVQVFIGQENEWPPLRECSLVLCRYGVEGEVYGMLGLLGPTRMEYGRAISAVRYLSGALNNFVRQVYC